MNRLVLAIISMVTVAAAADTPKTYTGTITDSMCVMNHKMMNITPDSRVSTASPPMALSSP